MSRTFRRVTTSALAVLLILVLFAPPGLRGQDKVPSLELVGSALWTKAHDLKVEGTLGYAAFLDGLVVLDVTDMKNPVGLSHLYLGGGFALAVRNGLAFVAAGDKGLAVVDVSDPKAPKLKGSLEPGGEARDIVLQGARAFLAAGEAGLIVVDISDPASPRIAARLGAGAEVNHLALRGNDLFLAAGAAGLKVVDVRDPDKPALAGKLEFEGVAEGIAVSGDFAYVADGPEGLRVIAAAPGAVPSLAATLTASGYCRSVDVQGKLLATGNLYDGGCQLFDLGDPAKPVELSTNRYTMYNEAWNAVFAAGRLAVIDYFSGIFFFDLSTPASPQVLGTYFTPSSIVAATMFDRFALAVGELSGLQVLDLGYPQKPMPFGRTDIFRGVQGLAVGGDCAYVTDRWSVRVFQLNKLKSPPQVASLTLPDGGVPRTIVVDGRKAYLTADRAGLFVIDVADPGRPKILGRFKWPGFAYGLAVDRTTVYVAHSDMGLIIFDVRDPRNPVRLGSLKLDGEPYGVAVQGRLAFVASGPAGLKIVDVSRPEAPKVVGTFPSGDFANGVAVKDEFVYLSDGKAGIMKIEVKDPAAPRLVAAFDTPGEAMGVRLSFGLLLVPDADSLLILKKE